jgi:predicted secreted protein with PEFG-CTERM motif
LIQNNEEIFRKAGTAPAGGSFEDFVFSEDNAGQILVKLDRINKSDEYVEISVNVVPEFGLFSLLVLGIAFVMVLIMGRKIMFNQNFQNNNIL